MVFIVFCAAVGWSVLCDRKSGDWFQKVRYGAPESGWPSSDSSWQCCYMLGTTTKMSMSFQVLGLWLHLKEMFFLGLGITVTEIKSTETRLKKHRCRDGMPKGMKNKVGMIYNNSEATTLHLLYKASSLHISL